MEELRTRPTDQNHVTYVLKPNKNLTPVFQEAGEEFSTLYVTLSKTPEQISFENSNRTQFLSLNALIRASTSNPTSALTQSSQPGTTRAA